MKLALNLLPLEKEMILTLERYGNVIRQAGAEMNPSVIAGYVFSVAKLLQFILARSFSVKS